MNCKHLSCLALALCILAGCSPSDADRETAMTSQDQASSLLSKYTTVKLTADLSGLTDQQRSMIPILIEASREMDKVFWMQAYGDRESLLSSIGDADLRRFADINYGPWDRLDGDKPFIEGVGEKPLGANFYPHDITKQEFEATAAKDESLKSLYTLVRRQNGTLKAIPYHEAYSAQHQAAAEKLRAAAQLAADPGLKRYLESRAEALLSDDYQPSDFAWMEMKDNVIDVVIGPIETYEDQLFGYKAGHEAYVLVKDRDWSRRLAKYISLLPSLQKGLPVADAYKQETPGSDSDLNAYDVVYYAGHSNAGSKTIAINLPNDEQVQLSKGTRRLQLKNAMRAKFDKIMLPIARALIAEDQQKHVVFDAFFANTMFHEVAHGLGIKNTINGKGPVRASLKEQASALEEGKADVLGLYMVTELRKSGELDTAIEDNYVTFLASIFRSVRFGASSAHGRANMVRFNFFQEMGAFSRGDDGRYRVDFDKMREAMNALSEKILRLQGDGDYDGVVALTDRMGNVDPQLQGDLDRLSSLGIPVDIVFDQGVQALGL